MSGPAFLFLNMGVSFVASLASFVVWHHFDLAGRWERRGAQKARDAAVAAGEPRFIPYVENSGEPDEGVH